MHHVVDYVATSRYDEWTAEAATQRLNILA